MSQDIAEYTKKIEEFKKLDAFKGMLEVHNTFRHNQPQNGSSDEEFKQWRERVAKQEIDDFKRKILQKTAQFVFRRTKITISESFPMPLAEDIIAEASHQSFYKVKKTLENCEYNVDAAKQTVEEVARFFSPEKLKEFEENAEVVIDVGNHSHILHGDSQKNRFKKEMTEEKMIVEEGLRILEEPIPALKQDIRKRKNPKAVEAINQQVKEKSSKHKQLAQKAEKIIEKPIITEKDAKTFIEIREKMRLIESEHSTLEQKFDWHDTELTFPRLGDELTSGQLHYNQWSPSAIGNAVNEIERVYREAKEREEASQKA